jgi:isoleucyl-tRNA synthetase
VEKGLVYQSKKPVYWSTGAQTALAEAEVEYAQRTDPAIFVKFAVADGKGALAGASFVIWTTTPWTLPANVGIAVHPKAKYSVADYAGQKLIVASELLNSFAKECGLELGAVTAEVTGEELIGLEAQHPFLPRTSKLIGADFVTLDTGTGQVHIAPGHGKDDYIAGQANGLPVLSPVDDYGKLTEDCGMPQWVGKYVFDANAEIVSFLRDSGALLAEQKYVHDYPHCWRSKTPIVFRAVEQFFINVDKIRGNALAAIDKTTWLPHWGRNRIYGTVEARPDWCISRQRTWGVPLPVFYDEKGTPIVETAIANKVADLVESGGTNLWFEKDDAWWASQLGLPAGTSRRNDTLDVWIDSGVSHQAVTSRHPELKACGGVADIYLEATDQHRGWFQSSLMTSVALTGHAPYKTVITHGFVVDKDTKKKVSKSDQGQGGYKKPMEADYFVGKYGADIVRLWAASVEYTNDVPFSEDGFARTSEAYRSFRNVLRILLANIADYDGSGTAGATTVDKWVLSKLQGVIATCRAAYEAYDFRRVFETLNQFCTVDLSALYVDITKDRMYCDAANSPRRRATQAVMHACFESVAKLLAPILAYTADEAWEFSGKTTSIHIEKLPEANPALRDEDAEARVVEWLEIRTAIYQQAIEPARQSKEIAKSLEATVDIEVTSGIPDLQAEVAELTEFFIVSDLTLSTGTSIGARVRKSYRLQCPRCWRHQPLTAKSVCGRCDEALG